MGLDSLIVRFDSAFRIFEFCILLRRLFRFWRPLFAMGVLAPDEALCREAGVKQSGITIIYRPCIFLVWRMWGFCFSRRGLANVKYCLLKMDKTAFYGDFKETKRRRKHSK